MQGDLGAPPLLTESERDALLAAAWELNEYVPEPVGGGSCDHKVDATGRVKGERVKPSHGEGERPGDDFNRRGDVRALLERAGWVLAREGELRREALGRTPNPRLLYSPRVMFGLLAILCLVSSLVIHRARSSAAAGARSNFNGSWRWRE